MHLAAPGEEGSAEVSGKTPPGARCVPGGWMLVGDRSEGGCRHEPNFQNGDGKRSAQQYCSSTWRPCSESPRLGRTQKWREATYNLSLQTPGADKEMEMRQSDLLASLSGADGQAGKSLLHLDWP